MRQERSFCRICSGTCGTIVTVGDDERIVSIRGDRAHPLTAGYACSKGVDMAEMHNRADRILRPLKRNAEGGYDEISLEQATAEIAERMRGIIARDGPASIATFCGTASFWNTTLMKMLAPFMRAIGSSSMFTSLTIDCSSKVVTAVRMGSWAAGKLSGKYNPAAAPSGGRRSWFDFPPTDRDVAERCLAAVHEVAKKYERTPGQVALAWLLDKDVVTSIVAGANNVRQLEQNLAAINVELDSEDVNLLDRVGAIPLIYPGWMLERHKTMRMM